MKLVVIAITLACATLGHAHSPLVGGFNVVNCPTIVAAFQNPSPLLLTVVRNNPRQADDFIRNYSRCTIVPIIDAIGAGNNAIGMLRTTPDACRVVGEIGVWLHRHDVHLTGGRKSAGFSGGVTATSLVAGIVAEIYKIAAGPINVADAAFAIGSGSSVFRSGNAADLANNANDCLRYGSNWIGHYDEAPIPDMSPVDDEPATSLAPPPHTVLGQHRHDELMVDTAPSVDDHDDGPPTASHVPVNDPSPDPDENPVATAPTSVRHQDPEIADSNAYSTDAAPTGDLAAPEPESGPEPDRADDTEAHFAPDDEDDHQSALRELSYRPAASYFRGWNY